LNYFAAEFIIALVDENPTFDGFRTALEKNDAEFTVRFEFNSSVVLNYFVVSIYGISTVQTEPHV